jgi:hypothetical protein
MGHPRDTDHSEGLLALWVDVDPDYRLRFQEWHNCEHIPERVSIPGFLVGRRYRGCDGGYDFLLWYEAETNSILGSAAYLAALNRPTPWTQESLAHFRRPLRNVYKRLARYGSAPRFDAPYVATYRFAGDADRGACKPWLAAVSQANCVTRARLYEMDAPTAGIMTSEKKIYQAQVSPERYLALIECTRRDPWEDPQWQTLEAAVASDKPEAEAARETYWLEVAHYAG